MGDSGGGSHFALRRSSRLLDRSIPQSGSLYGLRRSLRLHSKSQSTQMASRKRRKPRSPKPRSPKPKRSSFRFEAGEIIFRGGYFEMGKYLRYQRRSEAHRFRSAYSNGFTTSDRWDEIIDKRLIVVSGKEHVFPDVGRSHGIMWVGVHGIDSMCAVYLNKKPDMQRIIDRLGDSVATYFMDYVLSEMEDIADSPPYSDKTYGKPFAVVSLPDSSNADEESLHEASAASVNAQGKAIDLLKHEMIRDSEYTKSEIEKIAISAFQLLCGQKLKANEIRVCGLRIQGNDYDTWNLSISKIDRHLAVINRPSFCVQGGI